MYYGFSGVCELRSAMQMTRTSKGFFLDLSDLHCSISLHDHFDHLTVHFKYIHDRLAHIISRSL